MNAIPTRLWLCTAFFLAVSLCGCMKLGPDFKRPGVRTYDSWSEGDTDGLSARLPVQNEWWEIFGDPELAKLVRASFDSNLPLRVAGLRVVAGRAQLGIAVGELYPQSQTASGGYTYSKESRLGPTWPQPSAESKSTSPDQVWQNTVALSAAWELDFWGRVRNLKEAALEAYLATDAARHAVTVSLIAQVADAYFGLLELDERLALARQTVVSREKSLGIFT